MLQRVQSSQRFGRARLYGYGLALLAHIIWGSYPVISKRLLQSVPPFSLLALGYAVALFLSLPALRSVFWEALHPRRLLRTGTWLLMAAVVARSATNILSIKYTLAIYVQLINLMTPFAVALLGQALFREPVPPRTYPALALSTFGSALMLLSGSGGVLGRRWSGDDTLGIVLALASTICLAFYMLLTRHVQRGDRSSSPWEVLVQQTIALEAMGLIGASLGAEPWEVWAALPPATWLLFALFVLVNLIGGNLVQIGSLRYLNTALFTSLIGTRLVSALVLAWLLLGERLTSPWQVAGALIVITTITWYLRGQSPARNRAMATSTHWSRSDANNGGLESPPTLLSSCWGGVLLRR